MINWLNLAFDVGAMVAALIAVFEGARRIACDGTTRKRVFAVVAGLVWCAALSTLQFYVSTVDSLKLNLKEATELAADWGKDLSPTQREESSRAWASVTYTTTGTLVDYFDVSGTRKKYAPTQIELREREKAVMVYQQLDTLSENAHASGFRLILFPLFALLLGWAVGKERRHVAANQ